MRLTFVLFIFIAFLIVPGCKKDHFPKIELTLLDFEHLTFNNYDKNRLCMAEVFSKLLLNEKFREFIQSQSINKDQKWNNEILLVKYWNEKIYDNLSLFDLCSQIIQETSGLCIGSAAELESMFFDDPLLVLKIPDIIDPSEWDIDRTIPFLYVNTNRFVRNNIQADSVSMVGIHGSGVIDRYTYGVPKYFPVVLKKSEDYVLIDDELNLSSGVNFNVYHDYDAGLLSLQNLLSHPIVINGEGRYIVNLNELVRTINQQSNKIQAPYPIENCTEACIYDCIPASDRKLITTSVFIDNFNPNALAYEFSSSYRFNSHFILEDNVIFIALTRQFNANNSEEWKKNLIGSFRINDLFDFESSVSVYHVTYDVNGELYEFPELNISYDVFGTEAIPLDNLVLASKISPGDQLRFASMRIKLDMLVEEVSTIDGGTILTTEFFIDNITNYDLYCLYEERVLGFNSMALRCGF